MSLPYGEGTWFAVPLRTRGFAAGVVARSTAEGKVIVCYFFGPRRGAVPSLREVAQLAPEQALTVLHVGDLGLINGEWKILGNSATWRRETWPIPPFVRTDPLSGRSWRVEYDDANPNRVVRETPLTRPDPRLRKDSLLGSGAAELTLDKLLVQA